MAKKQSSIFDVVIVGAGPAGLFAAYELKKLDRNLSVALVDRGNRVENRRPNEVMKGFGGAGTFSDGKLHYTPILSHKKGMDFLSEREYVKYVDYVDKVMTKFGVDSEYFPKDMKKVNKLVEHAQQNDIKLYVRKVRHVGTDLLKNFVTQFQNYLEDQGVILIDNTDIVSIDLSDKRVKTLVTKDNDQIKAKKVLLAPGRVGARWLQKLCQENNIEYKFDKIEVGVRVEFPEAIMRKFGEEMYEAIFEMRTPTFDDVIRTFCPCPRGKVAIENYQGYVCVNGHSDSDHNSENSNFAFVTEIELTDPIENTTMYARSIAEMATLLGGGKPLLQRLVDLRRGRRSTWTRIKKSYINPSLTDVTPGDIAMGMPYRVVANIIEGLERMDSVMPGINAGSTLLYAPEVKYRGSKVKTDKNFETSIKGVFVAGDGAGVAGNIIGAAATGVIAARGMI